MHAVPKILVAPALLAQGPLLGAVIATALGTVLGRRPAVHGEGWHVWVVVAVAGIILAYSLFRATPSFPTKAQVLRADRRDAVVSWTGFGVTVWALNGSFGWTVGLLMAAVFVRRALSTDRPVLHIEAWQRRLFERSLHKLKNGRSHGWAQARRVLQAALRSPDVSDPLKRRARKALEVDDFDWVEILDRANNLRQEGLLERALWEVEFVVNCLKKTDMKRADRDESRLTLKRAEELHAEISHEIGGAHEIGKSSQGTEPPPTPEDIDQLNEDGAAHFDKGEYGPALRAFARCVQWARSIGYVRGEAFALGNIGLAHQVLSESETGPDAQLELRKALSAYERARALDEREGYELHETTALNNIGLVAERLGDLSAAFEYHRRAFDIHLKRNDKQAQAITAYNVGRACNAAEDARTWHQRAAELFEEVRDVEGKEAALAAVARVEQQGTPPQPAESCPCGSGKAFVDCHGSLAKDGE